MKVRTLDHVNIRTERLAETVEFYTRVLGMTSRPPPGPRHDPPRGAWLYDGDDRPVVHVGTFLTNYPNDANNPASRIPARGGGAVNHVALECEGYDETLARLKAENLTVSHSYIASMDLRQIFVEDPNGVTLELNFRGDAAQ